MFKERKVAGDRVVIDPNALDWKAIAKELINEHDLHCEADREDGRKPFIWIDASHAESDGRNIYVQAECQDCMQGVDTAISDDAKYHIHAVRMSKRERMESYVRSD